MKHASSWNSVPKYQPFPELPQTILPLFGVRYEEYDPPMPPAGWGPWLKYAMFREGVAQLLSFNGRNQTRRADAVSRMILRDTFSETLFTLVEGQTLTYHGEVTPTQAVRSEVSRLRKSSTGMYVMDVLYEANLGNVPEAWQELAQEAVELHGEVGGDI